jgi:hypothetical protein
MHARQGFADHERGQRTNRRRRPDVECRVDIVDAKPLETGCIQRVSVVEPGEDERSITRVVDIDAQNNEKRCACQR